MGISFERVSYRYRDRGMTPVIGLDELDVVLKAGGMTAVLGAPGSGKSTLLQHMNGLIRPDKGRIQIMDYVIEAAGSGERPGRRRWGRSGAGGRKKEQEQGQLQGQLQGQPYGQERSKKSERDVKHDNHHNIQKLRQRVGLVFQYPEQQLFEETVERELMFAPLNFGMSEAEAREAALQAAASVGLDEKLLTCSPFRLSSGQMRKVALAAVLAADPDVIALDEPTASLDPVSRQELMELLRSLCTEQGKTVLIVTHRLEEAAAYADEFVVLKDGGVIFQGDVRQLLDSPDTLEAGGIVPPRAKRTADVIAATFGASGMQIHAGQRQPAAAYPSEIGLDASDMADWCVKLLEQRGVTT